MSTIVDQLRDRAYATKAGDPLCEEAAALIEGLEWRSKVHANVIARLSAEVERLRDGRGWIPLSDRQPAMGDRVMLGNAPDQWVAAGEKVLTGAYLHWEDDGGDDMNEPTHWMPMPEAPKE